MGEAEYLEDFLFANPLIWGIVFFCLAAAGLAMMFWPRSVLWWGPDGPNAVTTRVLGGILAVWSLGISLLFFF